MVLATDRKGLRHTMGKLWAQRRLVIVLAVPALCFCGKNNLLFVGVTYLSAAAAQGLEQSKTLWAAIFSVIILRKRFSAVKWVSFVLLVVGVVLIQNQDAQSLAASVSGAQKDAGSAMIG